MTTRLLETEVERDRVSDGAEDWMCDVLAREGLTRARNLIGARDVARLELVVDGEPVAAIDVDGDLGQACGVSIASALLQRRSRDDRCQLRLSVHDEEVGAELLVREWHI